MSYIDQIAAMGACHEAMFWLREANHPTLQTAWDACPRADWMVWLLVRGRDHADLRALVFCACDIAETVISSVPAGEDRPILAIDTARRWARGEATAEAAEAVAAAAAYAADAAAYAADAAADAAAHADIVRHHFPAPPEIK